MNNPIPDNVRAWTVSDVARWLDSLTLPQYVGSFVEGSVDGPFLMELREEDLVQVLGIKHKLHVRKILFFREKLKPLSQQEQRNKEAVEIEVYLALLLDNFCLIFTYLRYLHLIFFFSGPSGCYSWRAGSTKSRHCVQSGAQRPHQARGGVSQYGLPDRRRG